MITAMNNYARFNGNLEKLGQVSHILLVAIARDITKC